MPAYQQINVACNPEFKEIIMAEFAAIGYDSFQETDNGFITYADSLLENESLDEIISRYKGQSGVSYNIENIAKENWNKKWEESYEPIIIDKKCIVRTSFHPPQPDIPIEIIIDPKMSFGTGHHETTCLMMEAQLNLNHKNKTVLDAGCGTGILSILAGKLGAQKITAFDVDEWIIDNVQENFIINGTNGDIFLGAIQVLGLKTRFDIILANINKNVLLEDIPFYAGLIDNKGSLLLSGFFKSDLQDIEELALKNRLHLVNTKTKNDWAMAQFLAI